MRGRGLLGIAAVLALTLTAALASTASAAPTPQLVPGVSPPGANLWSCRPTAAHPTPVILVHGTFGDMTVSWNLISPALKRDGYCVYALDYGNRGTGAIEASGQQLAAFVARVRSATGAAKVSFVGHSQGGMLPRYVTKSLGLASVTQDIVGLVPSNHGTTNPFAPPAGTLGCPACAQQAAGSPFMTNLNAGGDTLPGIDYTVVTTRYDEVVTPYTSALLSGSRVTNVVLQDKCPGDVTEHLGIIYDPVALQWIESALARSGPADPALAPRC
jgi:triacylglycerol esterase/lipase EstA (alpha/beta hydrolase family)